MGSAITGWGTALPPGRLDNAELSRRFKVDEDWIFRRTGINQRAIASENETTSSLATEAAREALARAEVEPGDLDLIILATCTPDHQIPACAPIVQANLGAHRAAAYDTNAVCAGFLYALAQASALVESGSMERVLVCGADVMTRVTSETDRGSTILFGDGGGAVVVERTEGPSSLGPFHLRSDGSTAHLLRMAPGSDTIEMKGREIYRHAVDEMSHSVREVLFRAHLTMRDVRLLIAHQANGRILTAVGERLALAPEQVVNNISEIGNTSASSIPIALAESADSGLLQENDVVVLTAIGAGLVWGAGIVRWTPRPAEHVGSGTFSLSFVGDTRA